MSETIEEPKILQDAHKIINLISQQIKVLNADVFCEAEIINIVESILAAWKNRLVREQRELIKKKYEWLQT